MVPWRQWVAAVCGGDGPQRSAMARARSPVVSLKPIVNWDDSVECAKTDVVDRASPVRQRFRRVQ